MSEAAQTGDRAWTRESPRELAGPQLGARVLGSVPRQVDLVLGAFGQVSLTLEGYGASSALRGGSVAFALSRGRETGRLALDAALASRLVAAALGADGELAASLGRLGPGARGVVAGVVAGVLQAAGAPLAVALEPAALDAALAPETVVVSIGVAAAGGTGWAALEAPRAWLEDAARLPADALELAALTVEAAVELGTTTLAAGDLAAVAPGDAVVFDGERAVASAAPWAARLVVGGYAADAAVAPDGGLTIAGGFSRAAARPLGGGQAARADRADTTVLTALPVEVVAELARVRLRGDEVVALGPGTIIPLGGARFEPVVLRVGGQPWAEGELADVEGELAVRVTRRRG